MGDKSNTDGDKTNLVSSQVVTFLNDRGFNEKLELFLSIPANPNFAKIQKKLMPNQKDSLRRLSIQKLMLKG